MIAHSFRGAVFGPAQELHGATFVVRAAFLAERLDDNGIVVDIGRAHEVLDAALKPLNYRNLDDLPQFEGANTTTEFLTRYVFEQLADAARARLAGLSTAGVVVIDGLALGVLPDAAGSLSRKNALLALVHHPLALETGLDAAQAKALRASERAALACAHRVVATSAATAR